MGVRGIQKELVDSDVHQLGILFHGSTEAKITWETIKTKHTLSITKPTKINSCLLHVLYLCVGSAFLIPL